MVFLILPNPLAPMMIMSTFSSWAVFTMNSPGELPCPVSQRYSIWGRRTEVVLNRETWALAQRYKPSSGPGCHMFVSYRKRVRSYREKQSSRWGTNQWTSGGPGEKASLPGFHPVMPDLRSIIRTDSIWHGVMMQDGKRERKRDNSIRFLVCESLLQ